MGDLQLPKPQYVYTPERSACETYASEWESFMRAIVEAEPGERLPRLVAADWLEENGEGELAGYLRACCRVEELEATGPIDLPVQYLTTYSAEELLQRKLYPPSEYKGRNIDGTYGEITLSNVVMLAIQGAQRGIAATVTSNAAKWSKLKHGSIVRVQPEHYGGLQLEQWEIWQAEGNGQSIKAWLSYRGPWERREEHSRAKYVRDDLKALLEQSGKVKHLNYVQSRGGSYASKSVLQSQFFRSKK